MLKRDACSAVLLFAKRLPGAHLRGTGGALRQRAGVVRGTWQSERRRPGTCCRSLSPFYIANRPRPKKKLQRSSFARVYLAVALSLDFNA